MAKFMDVHSRVLRRDAPNSSTRRMAATWRSRPRKACHFERAWLDPEAGKVSAWRPGRRGSRHADPRAGRAPDRRGLRNHGRRCDVMRIDADSTGRLPAIAIAALPSSACAVAIAGATARRPVRAETESKRGDRCRSTTSTSRSAAGLRGVLPVHRQDRHRRDGPALRQGRAGRGSRARQAPAGGARLRAPCRRRLPARGGRIRGPQGRLARGQRGEAADACSGSDLTLVRPRTATDCRTSTRSTLALEGQPARPLRRLEPDGVSCRGTGRPGLSSRHRPAATLAGRAGPPGYHLRNRPGMRPLMTDLAAARRRPGGVIATDDERYNATLDPAGRPAREPRLLLGQVRRRADAVRARPVHDDRRVHRRAHRPAALLGGISPARRRRPATSSTCGSSRAARSRRCCGSCRSAIGCG